MNNSNPKLESAAAEVLRGADLRLIMRCRHWIRLRHILALKRALMELTGCDLATAGQYINTETIRRAVEGER